MKQSATHMQRLSVVYRTLMLMFSASCTCISSAPVQMMSKKSSGQKGLLNTHSTLMAFDICTLCMAICKGTDGFSAN